MLLRGERSAAQNGLDLVVQSPIYDLHSPTIPQSPFSISVRLISSLSARTHSAKFQHIFGCRSNFFASLSRLTQRPQGDRKTIAELMDDDVIELSDSPWASPAILVHQKGEDRFCIDYRKINMVLKADQYPIPRVDDILAQFSGMSYYTPFDANKGFHQVVVDEKDREKTAFRTHVGLHQFKRMPFGLKTGPSVFQRLTDRQIALVYIDDIIIYSRDFSSHLADVDTILKLVIKSGITLSPKISYVAHHSIKALGHSVSNLGIGTLEETVRAVKEYPVPRNVKELQRFLGLAVYYRRFVRNFARITTPLYKLLKKDQDWK